MPELPEMPDRFGSERVAEITDKLTPELLAAWFEATEPRDPAKHYVDGAVTLDDQVLLHTSIDFITRDGEVIARWRELVREARAHLTLGFPLVFRSYSTSRDQETDPERRLVYIRLDTSTLPEAAGPGHGPFKVQLRVNALGMSELSVDADLTGLPVAQQRAHLAAMTAPLVRFGLTGRWGEVKRTTAQQLTVEVIAGPTQRIGYGDFDLV
jgi:hypothetical protein